MAASQRFAVIVLFALGGIFLWLGVDGYRITRRH